MKFDLFIGMMKWTAIDITVMCIRQSKVLESVKVVYSPTNTQVNCLKVNIKIYIKTAPTCFSAVTPSSGSSLSVLAKVTVVKIVH